MRLNRYILRRSTALQCQYLMTTLLFLYRFMTKLDADGMEDKLDSRVPLSGKDYREILEKLNDLLIDVNAHLESGNRYYNFLFEKALCVNFNSIVYKQYDKLVRYNKTRVLFDYFQSCFSLDFRGDLSHSFTNLRA